MGKWFQDKSFSTEKREQGIKARKGHCDTNARKMHRALGILLAAALLFQTMPFDGTAVSASESSGGGLCTHHTEHTPDCGYKEAEPGHGCTHEHTEDCYRTVEGEDGSTTKELDCHHEHDESCGYREAAEGSPCTFVCEICKEGTDEAPEDKTDDNEINDENSENPGTESGDEIEEPGTGQEEEPDAGQEECICEELCTEVNGNGDCRINTDCPVCGAEGADLSDCKGKDVEENAGEDVEESTVQQEDTGLCKHHQEHDDACGYLPESEDSEGSPCTYECRICPVEKLIAALPDAADITEDNAEDVRVQLDKILALFAELTEDEQEQIDLSRVYELQGALDNANAPIPLVNGDVTLTTGNKEVIFTVGECGDNCQGHTITQKTQSGVVEAAKILVESGTHDITFSGLNLNSAAVGIMPGGTMNLTLEGGNTVQGEVNKAGIYIPMGATLVITEESKGSLTVSGNDGAGIGGAWYAPTGGTGDFNCGTVVINGGTIVAAGEGVCAGIGGAYDEKNKTGGNGGTVTINGGTVTATGGVFGNYSGAGIGGGGAISSSKSSGCGGSLTINGGHVTLTASGSSSYGFGKGYGRNPSGTCSLTLADESYLTLTDGTNLDPNGTYTINGDPTEDMIVVPELVYTGEILDTSEIRIDDSKTGTATYFGQAFQVKASADGWVLQDLGEVKEGGEYTAVFKKDNKEISKTFTVAQSGTHFVGDGTVKTYKGSTACSNFTPDDTITVKATPTATGAAPVKVAARVRDYTAPAAGQMAVFVGDIQVSDAASANSDGSYTMTVNASDVLEQGNVELNGDPVTLTAKFVGNNNMADATGTVNVNISAAAKVVNGSSITYVSNLDNAFTTDNSGAEVTLLANVDLAGTYIDILPDCPCTLDLNGYTVSSTGAWTFFVDGGNITIKDSGTGGKVQCEGNGTAIKIDGGIVSIENGIVSGHWGVDVAGGSANISGTAVISGNDTGLRVAGNGKAVLSGGTFSGVAAITVNDDASVTLKGLLAQGYAYHRNGVPVTKAEAGAGAVQLDSKAAWLSGTVTVQECEHTGEGVCEYTHTSGTTTHQQTCLACGKKWDEENCSFDEKGKCNCGAVLAVALKDNTEELTYTGEAQTPEVNVTVDGTTLAAEKYQLEYGDNINAGNTAKVTVTAADGSFSGSASTTFSIGKAALTIKASDQDITYGEGIAEDADHVTSTGLCTGDTLKGITLKASSDQVAVENKTITPSAAQIQNAGNEDVSANYQITYETGMLTIRKADQTAPAPSATEENIKDTSITLTAVENGEYSRDGTNWQASPVFTGLSPNRTYNFYIRLKADNNHNASPSSTASVITTKKTALDGATVTVSGSYTYDGQEKTPEIMVTLNNTVISSGEYDISYSNSGGGSGNLTNAGTVTVTVTAKEEGNYEGTATGTFRIAPAMLTVSGAAAESRAYDGTNKVNIKKVTLNGIVPGDEDRVAVDVNGIQGMLSGVNAGTYSVVTLPELTLTGAGCGNYTLVQPETPVPASVKVTRLDTQITVGTDTYDKTFGDAAFLLDVTDNNPEADVRYEVTAGKDVISVEGGTVTIHAAGSAAITVSLPESVNYNAAENKTITVNVEKKGGYTVEALNRSYLYSRENTDSIDLGALLPKDCGAAAYGKPEVSGDVAYRTAPSLTDGKLSYTQGIGNINAQGSITVTVATQNYKDITITVKVKLTDQIPVELKEGTEVTLAGNTLTYGESLSKLGFNSAVFVDGDGNTVEGTLAWKDAAARPNAGTTSAVWVFTPTDHVYASVEGMAAIRVNRAVPTVSAAPTVADRRYNPSQVLKGSDLAGGKVAGVDGSELEGTWNWQGAGFVPTVNNRGYAAVFTPTDITNYETVTRTITVTVEKATPYIAVRPTAAGITYGDALSASVLSGGTVQYGNGAGQAGNGAGGMETVDGTFTWKEPSTKPVVADSSLTEYTVIFTPSDTADYHPVEIKVKLTVNKAQNAPNMPGSTMDVANSLERAGDVPLPEDWEWQASDKDMALEVGVAVNAVAVYTGADKGNYEKEAVTVAITRSACDHTAGDVLYTGAGEKAPTCTEDGLGHRECTKCGAVTESGILVKALGHTGGTATCSSRAVCTRCGQPYGDTDGNIHGNRQICGITAATCTAGGYTGDTYCMDCGAKTKTGKATPALGHDYTNTVTKEPTAGGEGIRTYTCTRCGHSYTESIPKLPEETHHHSYRESVTKQPTCTDTGVRLHSCSCGDSYTETIAALGHSYQSQMTKAPTVSAEGVMTYTCDRCGSSYTAAISKLEAPEPWQDPGTDKAEKPGTEESGTEQDTGPGSGAEQAARPVNGREQATRPGSGTGQEQAARPESGTGQEQAVRPGSVTGQEQDIRPEPGRPFIKDEDGKIGWDVIRAEEEKAQEGGTINVDMNGSTVVPGDIFDNIKGKNITITFDMGNGILWSVDGKSITRDTSSDGAGDIDFSVKTGVNTVPVDIINNITGESYNIQISLAYEGEFGFTAVLSIGLGKENAGYTANLYYYNESTGELVFICADEVSAEGMVSLAFTHASDYVIAIEGDEEEESGSAEPGQPENTHQAAGSETAQESDGTPESPGTDQTGGGWWIIVVLLLAAAIGAGVFVARKRKGEEEESRQ